MKLHIGGMEKKEGWKILNIQKNDGKEKDVDFVGDISDLSQFDDGSIEEVYASHTLEHVPQFRIERRIYAYLKDRKINIAKNVGNINQKKVLCFIIQNQIERISLVH